jgi:hypothetical protein
VLSHAAVKRRPATYLPNPSEYRNLDAVEHDSKHSRNRKFTCQRRSGQWRHRESTVCQHGDDKNIR